MIKRAETEGIGEVKKKKKRIDDEIKSLNDTADEFCTKIEDAIQSYPLVV